MSQHSDLKEWPVGDWLIARVFDVLNSSDRTMCDHLMNFVDRLNEMNTKSADKLWEIAQQYNLRSDNILFEPEIEKITNEQDKMGFLQELMDTYCIGAEIRILLWLYQKYFGEEYKPIRLKIEDVLRKWNENSTEEVYWELMAAGADADVAKKVIVDADLLDRYFQLKKKSISILEITIHMQNLIAKR